MAKLMETNNNYHAPRPTYIHMPQFKAPCTPFDHQLAGKDWVLPRWVEKAMTPLLFTHLLLCCKKGLDSCREWRRWERRESFWWKILETKGGSALRSITSHPGCPPILNWSFLLHLLQKLLSPSGQACRSSIPTSMATRTHCWRIYSEGMNSSCGLQWINFMNQTLILMLIHLFICKHPNTLFGDSVLGWVIPYIREVVFIIISKSKGVC